MSWNDICTNVQHLIQYMNIEQFHYVGHGLGAHIGIELADRIPEKIESFTCISTPLYYSNRTYTPSINFIQGASPYINMSDVLYTQSKEKHRIIEKARARFDRTHYKHFIDQISNHVSLQKLQHVPVRSLFLCGEFDTKNPAFLSIISAHHMKQADVHIIPEASHLLFIDQPRKVSERLVYFFTENQTSNNDFKHFFIDSFLTHNRQKVLKVHFLTEFKVYFNNEEIKGNWEKRKARELMCYLSIHKAASRNQIAEDLWPHLPIDKAKNNLRVCLNYLKRLLHPYGQIIETTRQSVQLTVESECDVELIKQLFQQYYTANDEGKLQIAIQLSGMYQNNWFHQFYDEWFIRLKNELESKTVYLLEDACSLAVTRNQLLTAQRLNAVIAHMYEEEWENHV